MNNFYGALSNQVLPLGKGFPVQLNFSPFFSPHLPSASGVQSGGRRGQIDLGATLQGGGLTSWPLPPPICRVAKGVHSQYGCCSCGVRTGCLSHGDHMGCCACALCMGCRTCTVCMGCCSCGSPYRCLYGLCTRVNRCRINRCRLLHQRSHWPFG